MNNENAYCPQCGAKEHQGDCVWMAEARYHHGESFNYSDLEKMETGRFELKVKFKKCGPSLNGEGSHA